MAIQIEDYYRTYGPMVLRRCRKLLQQEDESRDAMHDVFVQLLVNEQRLDHRAPSSLLYGIATNICLNRLRARKRREARDATDLAQRIAHATSGNEQTTARSLLGRLFAEDDGSSAAMAIMHLVDGMTLEEVAREFRMSVSGVRKRLRKLRAQVTELEDV